MLLWVLQETAAAASPMPSGRQSEGDVQVRQQEELATLQQQLQQLCLDVDQLTTDMKQMNVTTAQVTNPTIAQLNGLLMKMRFSDLFHRQTHRSSKSSVT